VVDVIQDGSQPALVHPAVGQQTLMQYLTSQNNPSPDIRMRLVCISFVFIPTLSYA
jgi:hypothetical protein